jgi:hypothetical protein
MKLSPSSPAAATTPVPRSIDLDEIIDLVADPAPIDHCWEFLTAQVPLTLLLDLALPARHEMTRLHQEMLAEPSVFAVRANR